VRGIGEDVNRRDFVMLNYPACGGQLPPQISYSQGAQAGEEGISNRNQAENKRYLGRNVGSRSGSGDSLAFALLTHDDHGASRLSRLAHGDAYRCWNTRRARGASTSPLFSRAYGTAIRRFPDRYETQIVLKAVMGKGQRPSVSTKNMVEIANCLDGDVEVR
jgi:hypothetical protein